MRGRTRKLSDASCREIWRRYYALNSTEYISMDKLARWYGVSAGTIQKVLDKKKPYDKDWGHGSTDDEGAGVENPEG